MELAVVCLRTALVGVEVQRVNDVPIPLQKSRVPKQDRMEQVARIIIHHFQPRKVTAPAKSWALAFEKIIIVEMQEGDVVEDRVDEVVCKRGTLQQNNELTCFINEIRPRGRIFRH